MSGLWLQTVKQDLCLAVHTEAEPVISVEAFIDQDMSVLIILYLFIYMYWCKVKPGIWTFSFRSKCFTFYPGSFISLSVKTSPDVFDRMSIC